MPESRFIATWKEAALLVVRAAKNIWTLWPKSLHYLFNITRSIIGRVVLVTNNLPIPFGHSLRDHGIVMSTIDLNAHWKILYREAIHESDSSLVLQRVSLAETAALTRQRELFYQGGDEEEKEGLEDALYMLRAFRTAVRNEKAA